eukprot:g15907.t1
MLRLDGGLGRTFHDENAGQGLRTKTGGMPARGDRPDLAKQPTAKQAQRLGGKGLQKADPNIISNRAQLGLSARDGAPSKQQRKKGLRDITNNTKQPTAQTLQKPSKTKAESSEVKTEEVEQIFGSSYLSPYQDPGVDVKLLRRACTSLGIKSLRDLDDVEFKLELPFEHIRDEEGLELDAAALAAEDAAVRELGLMTDLTAGLADLEQLADMDGLLDD